MGSSSNTFRKEYRRLHDHEIASVNAIKDAADMLLVIINNAGGDQRQAALAVTKLEESVMWAVKSITG